MAAPALVSPAARSRDELLAIWRESLLTDNCADPKASALRELSLYFNISEDEALARCQSWESDSVKEWEAAPRDTPDGLLNFYRTQQSWIFDTVWYHALQCTEEMPPESAMIAHRLKCITPGKHLDFGAGPGSTSLFFHQLGWEVSLADISTTLQAFARWRLDRRGIAANYYDTSVDRLPDGTFDLITACDVMVHVPDPAATLADLHRALKPGGYLFFNVDARPRPSRETQWHLYPFAYPILRPVRRIGFEREPRLEFFHVYRKLLDNSPLRARLVSAFDFCRYNYPVSWTAQAARDLRSRVRASR
jgi:SAM-dependent methyltransferase